jgi:hypothetical protein
MKRNFPLVFIYSICMRTLFTYTLIALVLSTVDAQSRSNVVNTAPHSEEFFDGEEWMQNLYISTGFAQAEGFIAIAPEVQMEENILVYPNPATVDLWVELNGIPEGSYIISLLDVTGKLLMQRQVELAKYAREHFSLSEIPGGVYFIRITDRQNKVYNVSRVIKTE